MNTKIPKGWKQVKLEEIGDFSKGAGITKKDLSETGCNAIRYGELYTKHNFKVKRIYSFIDESIIPTTKKIKKGAILFAGSGETIEDIGKSATYLFDEPCYVGGDTIIFNPTVDNSLFLAFVLNVGNARKELRRRGQGQSVVHIYKKDLEKLSVLLPPLPEQSRIVSILQTWDKALEKLNRKIELKKNIKKALLQKLMTGKTRLPGFNGEWESVKLRNVCDISRGGSPRPIQSFITNDKDGLNWLRIGDIKKGARYIDSTSQKIIHEGLKKTTQVEPGDFILSNSMSFGRPYIMKIKACIHDGWLALKNISSNVNKSFLYYLITSQKIQNEFLAISAGSGVQNLKKETVMELGIKIPSIKEQTAITIVLTTSDDEIEALEKKRNLLEEQKKYLLNNLVTGKIRTPENLST